LTLWSRLPPFDRGASCDHASLVDAESVRTSAKAAAEILRGVGGEAFRRLLPFFAGDPVADELPSRFIPAQARRSVSAEVLHELAVAGRLVYAQIRWLDDLVDEAGAPGPASSVHTLSEALGSLARSKFEKALTPSQAAPFFSTLSDLYARYATSLVVDKAPQLFRGSLKLDEYVAHAKARAAPVRAPVDALLLLHGATEDETQSARACFELCAAAVQLYDDALDIEQDFRHRRLSWVVTQTLSAFDNEGQGELPGADRFYETALVGGFLTRNLAAAEALFSEAMRLADPDLPGCLEYQKAFLSAVRKFKDDLEALIAAAD
jgi:hypothetical protein